MGTNSEKGLALSMSGLPLITEERKEQLLYLVGKGLGYQFETYSWSDMIKDLATSDDPEWTEEERKWAEENTSYEAYRGDTKIQILLRGGIVSVKGLPSYRYEIIDQADLDLAARQAGHQPSK